MRISKNLAESTAEKLLAKKKEAYKAIESQMEQIATVIATNTVPKTIMEASYKYKGYFKYAKAAQFIYPHTNKSRIEVNLSHRIPFNGEGWSNSIVISGDSDEIKKLFELDAQYDKLRSEYRQSFKIVSETIFGLKTALQVKKHFPEAFELLPKESTGSLLPMVNLNQVRALVS